MSLNSKIFIDHSKLIDGFEELKEFKYYLSFNSYCGICDSELVATPVLQKHILEVKGVPVKMLRRGALFCDDCAKRRARINYLRKGDRFLKEKNGLSELKELEILERVTQNKSKNLYRNVNWPYLQNH